MPSKSHAKGQNGRSNSNGGSTRKSPAATDRKTSTPTPPPPSFSSAPHATSGDRLAGVEVSSSIPALMSELGELLQQTPGGGGSGGGGALWRGQNGGLLFENLDGAAAAAAVAAAAAAASASPSEAAATASALFGGLDASHRLEQVPPGALERLSQVLNLQQRQHVFSSSAAAAAAAAAASFERGLRCGTASLEVLDDDEDEADAGVEVVKKNSKAAESTRGALAGGVAGDTVGKGGSSGPNSLSAKGDGSSTANRCSNVEEMFEAMQRSLGNYVRGVTGEKSNGSGIGGDTGIDPTAYSDPLTQLELFRAMMVATSRGRSTASFTAAAANGVSDGKVEDSDARLRASTGSATAQRAVGGASAATANNNEVTIAVANLPDNIRSFWDMFNPQMISHMMLQPRASKTTVDGDSNGILNTGKSGDASAAVRDVDMAASGAASLSDLQQRVEQVRGLSGSTLEALAEGEVSDSTSSHLRDLLVLGDAAAGGSGLSALTPELERSSATVGYCLTEAAAVAVSMLWSYLGSQQKDAPLLLGYTREEAQSQFNLLLFRLRQELFAQPVSSLVQVSRCFGSCVRAEAEDIYRAINAVGVLLFFTCKPLPLLERTCSELRLSLSDLANTDGNIMPELIAEKLAAFLYPMKEGKLSFAHLSFIPRMQVHEHAPGNYTCTVDNASNMGRMQRERLLSNRFSCSRIKWRAALLNDKGDLKFLVWHRHTAPLSLHLLVRTSEPKKKKKSGVNSASTDGADATATAAGTVDELRANSALFVERQVMAAPGEMVGFTDDFIELTIALGSPTTLQHGYRTYNKADDRLVFQFSLQLSHVGGAPFDGPALGTAAAAVTNTPKSTGKHVAQGVDEPEPSVSGSTGGKTDGEESKDDSESELQAAMQRLNESETAARAVVKDTARWEYRHLQNEECREAHRAQLKAEERGRKAQLAKVSPTPELLKEVEKLMQSVQAAQQQISKLQKEKEKEENEGQKTAEKLSQHQADLETLLESLEKGEAELTKLEADVKAAEARIQEKRARQARKAARKLEQNPWSALKHALDAQTTSTHHDVLAINDFGSFLRSSTTCSAVVGGGEGGGGGLLPQQQQQVADPLVSSSGGIGMTGSFAGSVGGGLSAFGTDPFSIRPTLSTSPRISGAGAGLSSSTPVFSTQPTMGMSGGNSPGHSNIGGSSAHMVGGPGAVGSGHTHLNNISSSSGGGASHGGRVSPMVPPSPGVMGGASTAIGSRGSPTSGVTVSIGSPGMPLPGGNGVPGGSSSSGAANAMVGGGSNMNGGGNGNGAAGGGGGLSFGLAPSLFSTNPVSHASHNASGMANTGHNTPNSLYTALDANAQPFSPSPPTLVSAKASAAAAAVGIGGGVGTTSPHAATTSSNHAGSANQSHHGSSSGGGGFAFTVTAGAHPGFSGVSSSPLYHVGSSPFTSSAVHDISPHTPAPFSTTPLSSPAPGHMFGMGAGGSHSSTNELQQQQQQQQHQGMFPPRPHSPNELLAFSTSLPWRN